MARLFGIAGVQMSVSPWDPDGTIDSMAQIIGHLRKSFPWVEMIVFHELCASGLVQFDQKKTVQQWEYLKEPIPGRFSDRLCSIATKEKCWLVPGSMYELDGDRLYNTSIAISPAGEIVAKYRKIFPWLPFESEVEAGTEFCVFDVPDVGRFGMMICYDQWFPEMARTLTWMGAEVILHPTMTPTPDRPLELVLSQANAIMNQCYFIDVNGIGPWGGGQSMIIDPDGRVIQQLGTHNSLMIELLDLDRVNITREYGNVGMTQTLKQLRDTKVKFPPYLGEIAEGDGFKKLGELGFLRLPGIPTT